MNTVDADLEPMLDALFPRLRVLHMADDTTIAMGMALIHTHLEHGEPWLEGEFTLLNSASLRRLEERVWRSNAGFATQGATMATLMSTGHFLRPAPVAQRQVSVAELYPLTEEDEVLKRLNAREPGLMRAYCLLLARKAADLPLEKRKEIALFLACEMGKGSWEDLRFPQKAIKNGLKQQENLEKLKKKLVSRKLHKGLLPFGRAARQKKNLNEAIFTGLEDLALWNGYSLEDAQKALQQRKDALTLAGAAWGNISLE